MTRPLPPGVDRLLGWTLPADQHHPIAGDLSEEYERSLAAVEGRSYERAAIRRAQVAVWWHAAQLAASFTWERLRRDRTLPPIADEAPGRIGMWDALTQDVVFGIRMLRRQPAGHARPSTSSRPRHISISARRLSLSAETARGRSA